MTHPAVERVVSASTQNQAIAAILFLYRKVLRVELRWLDGVLRPKQSRNLPVVLTVAEVRSVLAQIQGENWLIASLLCGAGLRLQEALTLRGKDRTTIPPEGLIPPLQRHVKAAVRAAGISRPASCHTFRH